MAGAPRRRAGPRRLSWLRLVAGFVFDVASVAVVLGVPGTWLWRHMDLSHLAAAQASAATGRAVTVGALKVGLGRTVTLDVSDVRVPNLPGGSRPEMAVLRHLVAQADLQSLLYGPRVLQSVQVDGLDVLLERIGGQQPNWRSGPKTEAASDPTGRSGFPAFRTIGMTSSRVTFRTDSGHELVTALDSVSIKTAGNDQPVALAIAGAYNGTKVDLDAALQSIDALHDVSKPFGTMLHFMSGDLTLVFDGTMTDPLNFNGLKGTAQLDAPDPKPLFAIAGASSGLDVPIRLDGPLEHAEPNWTWHEVQGQLGQDEVTKATLVFDEGPHGKPDHLNLDAAFATLNLNELIGSGAKGKRGGADLPLTVERNPGTLIQAKLAAGRLEYDQLRATNVVVQGAQTEGRIAIDVLTLTAFGTALKAQGRVEATPSGADVTASVSMAGADVQVLREELGFGSVPVTGRLEGEAEVVSAARTLNAALHGARVSAVVAMRGGAVAKEVIEMASTDVRALFRTNKGMTPVACLLAGVDMRAGVGTVAPLRVRAAEGTIAGSATFDLYRKSFDLTIGSEAKSTGFFALDIPVRVSGSFSSPSVSPAQWSAQGRAALAAADSLSQLPPALREWARRYPCPPSR